MMKIIILIISTFLFAQDPISITGEFNGLGLDSKPPELEWIYPSGDEYFEADEMITPQWNFVEDNLTVNGISLKLLDNQNNILEEFTFSDVLEYSFNLPNLINTTAYFELSMEDEFGYSNMIQSNTFYIGFTDPISMTAEFNGFTLDSQKPSVTVYSPNGGESFTVDQSIAITWNATDEEINSNSVIISLSNNGGDSFETLQSNIENSGLSIIETPDYITNEALVKVSVTDNFGNIGEDNSDNYFELLPIEDIQFSSVLQFLVLDSKAPEVTWINPNEGGILPSGEEIQTEWNTTDDSFTEMPVTVSIQENGNEISVIDNQASTGQHQIALPDIISDAISFRVSATDQFGNTAFDDSDNSFSLKKFGCTDELANNYNDEAEIDDGSCIYTTTMDLSIGNNLISLPGPLPNNSTETFLENIEEQCDSEIEFILGQGLGLFNTNDGWTGNLTTLDNKSGYWINSNSHCEVEYEINNYSDECLTYELGGGNNLVSYAGENNAETVEALGGEVYSGLFNFILGQGLGLFNTDGGWSGNLTSLENKKGYWLNSNIPNPVFQWGTECESVEPVVKEITEIETLDEFQFEQSTEQAFYLINNILIDGDKPKEDDLILAYHNDVLVGSAVYNSDLTVLPVMGRDLSPQTEGFIEEGEVPKIKLYQSSTCAVIALQADLDGFRNLIVSEVESVFGNTMVIPTDFALHPAYPNPFNPVTHISFDLPEDTKVNLTIYDVEGRKITTLTQGLMSAGSHSIEWNAYGLPSGVYFVKLDAGDPSVSSGQGFTQTQKVMLVK